MPHTLPLPYEYDGHKTYLQDHANDPRPQVRAVCNAGLYLGEILEHICFEIQRQGAPKPTLRWFPDHPPAHDPDH